MSVLLNPGRVPYKNSAGKYFQHGGSSSGYTSPKNDEKWHVPKDKDWIDYEYEVWKGKAQDKEQSENAEEHSKFLNANGWDTYVQFHEGNYYVVGRKITPSEKKSERKKKKK